VSPLTFVSWRWLSPVGYRSVFGPESVYALREMIQRHYPHPHRFVCVTDQPERLPGIETIRMWDDFAAIPSPFGRHNPSCYRRLKLFAPDAGKTFGERVVSIDLDTVITGDLTPLFDRPEDFVIWGESDFRTQWYNGSLWMLRTGTRPQVWDRFDEDTSPAIATRAGAKGSDQGWISFVLGKGEATWGRKDGVYSFRKHVAPNGWTLPADARIVNFHGRWDPWGYDAQKLPWVRAHYPVMAVPA
jgi:hypothetical protein